MDDRHGALVKFVLPSRKADIGGLSVKRVLPKVEARSVGPWVFFDHMGPATFEPGAGIDVLPHPHINLATVTYLFEGEILHRDSLGSEQAIRPGDINLMVAGSGITHSEREREEAKQARRNLHGLQLWLALPEDDEEMEPEFFHYPGSSLPVVEIDGVSVRVMIGHGFGVESPVMAYFRTLFAEANMTAGQSLTLDLRAEELAIYATDGDIEVDGKCIAPGEMAIVSTDSAVKVVAKQDAHVAIIGGDEISPRFMYWNFVSSRSERIEVAKKDWKEMRFPKVIGDEEEFVPLPE